MYGHITKYGKKSTSWYFDDLETVNLSRFFEQKTKQSMGRFEVFMSVGEGVSNFVSYVAEFRFKNLKWQLSKLSIVAIYKDFDYSKVTTLGVA